MKHTVLDPFAPSISLFRFPNAIFELHLHLPCSGSGTEVDLIPHEGYFSVTGTLVPRSLSAGVRNSWDKSGRTWKDTGYAYTHVGDQNPAHGPGTLVWTDQPCGIFSRDVPIKLAPGTEYVILERGHEHDDYVVRYTVRNKKTVARDVHGPSISASDMYCAKHPLESFAPPRDQSVPLTKEHLHECEKKTSGRQIVQGSGLQATAEKMTQMAVGAELGTSTSRVRFAESESTRNSCVGERPLDVTVLPGGQTVSVAHDSELRKDEVIRDVRGTSITGINGTVAIEGRQDPRQGLGGAAAESTDIKVTFTETDRVTEIQGNTADRRGDYNTAVYAKADWSNDKEVRSTVADAVTVSVAEGSRLTGVVEANLASPIAKRAENRSSIELLQKQALAEQETVNSFAPLYNPHPEPVYHEKGLETSWQFANKASNETMAASMRV